MESTLIGWADHTWNPYIGCRKVSEECDRCYMYRMLESNELFDASEPRKASKRAFDKPYGDDFRCKNTQNGNRPLVFVSSMTDLFLEEIDADRNEIWKTMKDNQDLVFLVLTKRPERILEHLPSDWEGGYENVWLGTSAGMQKSMNKVHTLLSVPAKHYFLSAEPLIGELDLDSEDVLKSNWRNLPYDGKNYLDWVIVGGESGNDSGKYTFRACQLEWIEKVVQQCSETGTPVFVKQLGSYLASLTNNGSKHGDIMANFPLSIQIQQFPEFDEKLDEVILDEHELDDEDEEVVDIEVEVENASRNNIFWNEKGKINIALLLSFLSVEGFKTYSAQVDRYNTTPSLVHVKKNVVSLIDENYILRHVYEYVKTVLHGSENFVQIMDEVYKQKLNTIKFENMLERIDMPFVKDSRQEAFFFFKNGVVSVKPIEVKLLPYNQINGLVWESDIIDFPVTLQPKELLVNSEFFQFVGDLAYNSDYELKQARIKSLVSIMGYLMHRYKDGTKTKAVTLMDEYSDGRANGGSGKTLIASAIGKMRNVAHEDGKLFKNNGNFMFSQVNINTDIMLFDDIDRNFNFEVLFSLTTTGIKIERKYKDAIYIPHANSPKVLLTTNYAVQGSGGSYSRRNHEYEVSHYYSAGYTPEDKFGHLLFDEWDDNQFNLFYSFMFECTKLYLNEGIIPCASHSIEKTKLHFSTNHEFFTWACDNIEINVEYDKSRLFMQFKAEYGYTYLKQKTFTEWLRKYAEYINAETKEQHSNTTRTIIFCNREERAA